jgi:predicted transcriptional regulator
MNIVNEEWRDISGYEGYYQVSSLGRVRSCDRTIKTVRGDRFFKGRILKPNLDPYGYPRLTLAKNGKKTTRTIHPLVAGAFLGDRPEGHEVNHKYGVKDDNRVESLEWCTHLENMRHAKETGLTPCFVGENHPFALLTELKVSEIRELRASGLKLRVIAEMYGVSMSVVSGVVYGNNWKHLLTAPLEKCPRLDESQVLEIRRLRSEGLKFKAIAKVFGVSQGAITGVVYRHTWKHI